MPQAHRFELLQRAIGGASATILVACKTTGERQRWNDAVNLGWYADLNGPAFNAYYSPRGRQLAESAAK